MKKQWSMMGEGPTDECASLNLTSGHNTLAYRLNNYMKKNYGRIIVAVNKFFFYHIIL